MFNFAALASSAIAASQMSATINFVSTSSNRRRREGSLSLGGGTLSASEAYSASMALRQIFLLMGMASTSDRLQEVIEDVATYLRALS